MNYDKREKMAERWERELQIKLEKAELFRPFALSESKIEVIKHILIPEKTGGVSKSKDNRNLFSYFHYLTF